MLLLWEGFRLATCMKRSNAILLRCSRIGLIIALAIGVLLTFARHAAAQDENYLEATPTPAAWPTPSRKARLTSTSIARHAIPKAARVTDPRSRLFPESNPKISRRLLRVTAGFFHIRTLK